MNVQPTFYAASLTLQRRTPALHTVILRFTLVLVAMFIALQGRPALAAARAQAQAQDEEAVLVHFAEGTTPEMREVVVAEMGGTLVTWMPQINVAEVRVPVQAGVSAAAMSFSVANSVASGVVTYAESDMVVEATAVYNDPDLTDAAMSYGLTQVDAVQAWKVITGSQAVVIAVIDSGIKLDHPEFAGRLVAGYDFVNNDDQADDDAGHGTHVAGVIAAGLDNGQGVAGVCPNCRLMPVKVLNSSNAGSWTYLAQGILFAVDNGARVLNLSLGASVSSETMALAIQYALDHDVIVVAAAGNNGTDTPFYPAALDGVIAVGATTNTSERWSRSNFGSYIDLVAPGAFIYSTYYDLNNFYHGYTYMSGTSMATPFVSGVVGLLLSANDGLSAAQVTDALVSSATDLGATGWDVEFGNGQVSALGALMTPAVGLAEQVGNEETPTPTLPGQEVRIFLPVLSNRN